MAQACQLKSSLKTKQQQHDLCSASIAELKEIAHLNGRQATPPPHHACAVPRHCGTQPPSAGGNYQTVAHNPTQDSDLARIETQKARALIEAGNLAEAHIVLKKAMNADVMYGPAHNNLGYLYYKQNKLYLAAWEFQYAAKLMKHHPEPRNNLGLVFEGVDRLDEAIDWYDQALKLQPDNPQFIGNAARARVKRGDSDDATRSLLEQVVMKDQRESWRDWARGRLTGFNRPR